MKTIETAEVFPAQNVIVQAWLAVNVLDSLLTIIALNMGAVEMSITYRLTGSMLASMVFKYLGVFLVVGILLQIRRLDWLRWFLLGMAFVISWNMAQIISNI